MANPMYGQNKFDDAAANLVGEVEHIGVPSKSIAASESGKLFVLDRAASMTLTLPAAKAGLSYEFHVKTTFTGTLTINAASSADTLQGVIVLCAVGIAVQNNQAVATAGFANPAAADHQYVADADTKGRLLGTHLVYKCMTDALWSVSGEAVTAGGVVTPFT